MAVMMKALLCAATALLAAAAASADFGPETNTTASPNTTTTTTPVTAEGTLQAAILAGAWIPFSILIGVSFIFSASYIKYFQHTRERECSSTMVAIFALMVSLITIALVPVDIFLVSSLKQEDGTFFDWATPEVVDQVKNLTQDAYYTFYALTQLFAFVLLPLSYFYFEEKDEEEKVGFCKRITKAGTYTLGFVVFMAVLMCIGAFATSGVQADCGATKELNGTNYKKYAECRAEYAETALTKDGGTNALSFTMGTLVIIGYLYFIFYTAAGMVILPINMIRSRGRTKGDQDMADEVRRNNDDKTSAIEKKYAKNKKKKMSARDRRKLLQVEEDQRTINRAVERVDASANGVCGKIGTVMRPFEFIFGIVFFLLSLFLVISLLMTSSDKLMQIVKSGDYKLGYGKTKPNVINPVDIALTKASSAFPVDYVIVTLVVYYFVMCTIAGVKYFGVRFLHLKMYKIRANRTVPQGLLFLSFILMFTILALNPVLLTLSPQYVTYGNQHYTGGATTEVNKETGWPTALGLATYPGGAASGIKGASPTLCSSDAPGAQYYISNGSKVAWLVDYPLNCDGNWQAQLLNRTANYQITKGSLTNEAKKEAKPLSGFFLNNGFIRSLGDTQFVAAATCQKIKSPCVQTRMAALLRNFFYNFWFLGAIYYWANWGFMLFFFLCLVVMTCKKRRSLMQAMVNDVQDDVGDSDDDMTPFQPSWA